MTSGEGRHERRVGTGLLPNTAVLELTYRCNHECIFCSCPWYANGFEPLPEMPVPQWKDLLDALALQGVSEFAFTGGEPLLKEGWRDIVSHACTLRVRRPGRASTDDGRPGVHLISNGRAMTDDALRFLAGSGVHLMFSLPGLETYPEHTGGGNPERVLSLFGKAAALGSAATVGVTVTRRNLHEVYSTIGEAFLAGAGDLLLNRFLPGGRGLAHWRDLVLDRDGTGVHARRGGGGPSSVGPTRARRHRAAEVRLRPRQARPAGGEYALRRGAHVLRGGSVRVPAGLQPLADTPPALDGDGAPVGGTPLAPVRPSPARLADVRGLRLESPLRRGLPRGQSDDVRRGLAGTRWWARGATAASRKMKAPLPRLHPRRRSVRQAGASLLLKPGVR